MPRVDKCWDEFVRILQPRDFLFPENEYKLKVIPEGLFKHLQRKARVLLETQTDAAEATIQHWQAIIDGQPPYEMLIEKKTRRGKEYVRDIRKADNEA